MQALRPPQFNMLALASRIQPLDSELSAAKLHCASVRARLEKAFAVSAVQNIGSHCRGTAIRRHSDLDVMVVLRKEEVLWGGKLVSSDTVIQNVLAELRGRFTTSAIRKDGLAATLAFGSTRQSLDVVPAVFSRFDKGSQRPVYLIPDGAGGWFETSPQIHDRFFAAAQLASGNKLRKVSQLVKAWKHARAGSLPIRSFYADMVLAASGVCVGAKMYGQCLHDFFAVLSRGVCGYLQDPCGIAGQITATDTQAQRQALVTAIEYACSHAAAALSAQARNNVQESNRQWNLVFNGTF
ncbi:nucleotidyltransferase [Roseateles sp. UC29_93]|uniref:nucleotidyltransferase domain-containing protein n=1 Tax=Roseateles sp. UC29_93 TaxID=3350177 RepID=UPI00366CBB0E